MPYIKGGTFEKWLFDTNTPKEKDKTKKNSNENIDSKNDN